MLESKIEALKNYVHQKFVKVAKVARKKEEDGKSNEYEVCCLKRLNSLLVFLADIKAPTAEKLREVEILSNNICGRDRFIFKPMDFSFMDYEGDDGTVSALPLNAGDITYENQLMDADFETVKSYLDRIIDIINYQPPWIQFVVTAGLQPAIYEIGSAGSSATVQVNVNKFALDFYDLVNNGVLTQYPREQKDTLPDQSVALDFQIDVPKVYTLTGSYKDLQKYLGVHEEATAALTWSSEWPVYYGLGALTALDDPLTVNTFIQSLNKTYESHPFLEVDILDGQVLYLFYPTGAVGDPDRQFHTENGPVEGSFKGHQIGVRTKSMDDFNVAGSKTYGVIRTDQEGIGVTRIEVKDIEL